MQIYRNEDGRLINLPNSPAKLLSIFADNPNGGRKCLWRTNYRRCPSSPFHGWLVWQVLTQKYDWLPLCWTKQLSAIEEKLFWRRALEFLNDTSFRKGLKKLLMKIDDTKRERGVKIARDDMMTWWSFFKKCCNNQTDMICCLQPI